MPYSLADIKSLIQPWSLRNFSSDQIHDFDDDEFVEMVNKVQRDLNSYGAINLERRRQTMDAGDFNKQLTGDIVKVIWIKYEDYDYADQYWGFVGDTLVFKETPTNDVVIDCEFLRQCEDVADDTDEVDLPEAYMNDLLDLIKKRMQVEFGQLEEALYYQYLKGLGRDAPIKRHHNRTGGVWRHWFLDEKGDDQYDITDNYVSQDSIYVGDDGLYYIYE